MIVNLREDFASAWQGEDPFAKVDALQGDIYRNVKGRRTLRFEWEGRHFFAKIHHGVGWGEIFKNLLNLRKPVLGAGNEWCAIAHLHSIGVATMTTVGFGSRGLSPASRESFILTEALEETVSLEDFCRDWPQQRPSLAVKHRLIDALADISRRIHRSGMCHRDYYLCHFHLHDAEAFARGEIEDPRLSVIDLHRAMIRRNLPQRWIVKDVAGLYFSALHIGLNRQDFLRFVRRYSELPLRQCLQEQKHFWAQVQARAMRMDRKLTPGMGTS